MGEDGFDEIVAIKKCCGKTHLKVIIESGELQNNQNIRIASDIAMYAGADFIKTSTGKFVAPQKLESLLSDSKLIDHALIKKAALTGKPLIISTGKATLSEIDEAVRVARSGYRPNWNTTHLRFLKAH